MQDASKSRERTQIVAGLIENTDSKDSAGNSRKSQHLQSSVTGRVDEGEGQLSTMDDGIQLWSSAPKILEHTSAVKAASRFGETSLRVDMHGAIQVNTMLQLERTEAVESPGRILMTGEVAAQGINQQSSLIQLEDADSLPTGRTTKGAEFAVPSFTPPLSEYAHGEVTAADVYIQEVASGHGDAGHTPPMLP